VSIAVELLTRPGLLLLDEPTTGLDSSNAARVVEVLGGLAAGGVNVLLSIHQPRPDVLRAMDRLLLLSGDGRVRITIASFAIQIHMYIYMMHCNCHQLLVSVMTSCLYSCSRGTPAVPLEPAHQPTVPCRTQS
jgi:ABC-type Mn2+/Zn2+ transport system ATPase subunit